MQDDNALQSIDVQPIDEKQTKKGKTAKIVTIISISILAIVATVVIYLLYFKQPTPTELYRQSIINAISNQSETLYSSIEIESDGTKLQGESILRPDQGDNRFKVSLDQSYEFHTIPVNSSTEVIVISKENGDKKDDLSHVETYTKLKSITSPDTEYKQGIEDLYLPLINKWVKSDGAKHKDNIMSLETSGALAVASVMELFLPVSPMDENDQKIFIETIDKYNLYQVGNDIQREQFKGIDARKVNVSVNKDAYLELIKELSERLSDGDDFKKPNQKLIDDLFGQDNQLSADVYFDLKQPKIIGAHADIVLDEAVTETKYNTKIQQISFTVMIEHGRELTIETPEGAIDESEVISLFRNR